MSFEIWRKGRVLATISMGNTWLYEAIAKGEFPAPVRLGARAVGWRRRDVEKWLEDRETIEKAPHVENAMANTHGKLSRAQKAVRNGET